MFRNKLTWENLKLSFEKEDSPDKAIMSEFTEFRDMLANHLVRTGRIQPAPEGYVIRLGLNYLSQGTVAYAYAEAPKPRPLTRTELETVTKAKDELISKQMVLLQEMEARLKALEAKPGLVKTGSTPKITSKQNA